MSNYLAIDGVYLGDCRQLLREVEPVSIALSVWSPPYFVGKSYEADLSFDDWQALLAETIRLHEPLLKPGAFLAINSADILCFRDEGMPRIQQDNISRHWSAVTAAMVMAATMQHPEMTRDQLAALLGCSEQTIDRRLHGNNIRGGKYETQTRVKLVGGLLEEWALRAGLYLYDRRIWVKDPAWANSQWHTTTYRAVDECEYIYIFWKPGETLIDRARLMRGEWSVWGSRGVWTFPSVRVNDEHEAQFPLELPLRLIRLLTQRDDIVLDCFLGSGTTALACLQTGRHFLGIEQCAASHRLAEQRIADTRAAGIQGDLLHPEAPA